MSQADLHPALHSQPAPPDPSSSGETSAKSAASDMDGEEHTSRGGEAQRRGPDKIRIYDLAREMGRDNKELLDVCDRLGIPHKSHSSTISAEQADQVRSELGEPAVGQSTDATSRISARISKPQPPKPTKSSAKGGDRGQILNVRPPAAERPQPPSRPTPAEAPSRLKDTSTLITPPRKPDSSQADEEQGKKTDSPSLVRPPRRPQGSEPRVAASSPPAAGNENLETEDLSTAAASQEPVSVSQPRARSSSEQEDRVLQRPTPPAPPRPQRSPEESRAAVADELTSKPSAPTPEVRKPDSIRQVSPKRQESPPAELLAKPVPPKPPERSARSLDSERRSGSVPPEAPSVKAKAGDAPKGPVIRGDRPAARAQRPEQRPEPPAKPTRAPQLVGAPVRPKSQVKPASPQRQDESQAEAPVRGEEQDLQKPRLQRKPSRPEPSPRHPAQEEERQVPALADAPVRPVARLKRKEDEEEDDELNLLKKPTRSQTKKKRSRRKASDGEGDGSELDVLASISAAKQAELNALKPLPRPAAKPASFTSPPPKSKPQPSSPRPRRTDAQPAASAASEGVAAPKTVVLESNLTVQDLADRMQISEIEIIKLLFMKGFMVNINQVLDIPTMELVAKGLEYEVEFKERESQAKKTEMLDIEDIDHLVIRPPVVTIMGHVDHGKTTLLDAIRDTKVVEGEAGGITQRIGAYHVDVDLEGEARRVVFLDTPGHEAFTSMRARGAKVTDIAVLVVAADDGVQPQTLEAISHAKAAQVPIVVAVNKIDKPESQPDRIKQQLSEHGLVPEEWGGDTPMVEVSALAKLNLDALLEMLLLVADIGELQANPNRPARGTVVEANLDKARGPLATILIQNGTLRVGDPVVAGSIFGRVKAMIDDRGQRLEEAGPSSAVQLLGLGDVPSAGDEFAAYPNEREARRIAEERAEAQRQARLQQQMLSRRVSLGKVSAEAQEGKLKELNLIIKTDVQGSAEAILSSLQQINQDEVQVRVLLSAPGEIVETDVDLAAASDAIIIGFSTNVSSQVRQLADRYGVDIREYDIIYNLLEDITAAMEGLLEPEEVEEPLGEAEVRMVITIGKGAIAGCSVRSGKVVRNALIRVRRQGDVIFQGRLDSLKRFKDDVREVASGFECGIGIDKFQDWAEGDIVEAYQMVTKRRTLITAESGRR